MALGTETHFWVDFFFGFEAKYLVVRGGIMGLT